MTELSEIDDELEIIASMFDSDEVVHCGRDADGAFHLVCFLPCEVVAEVRIPALGYPHKRRPAVHIVQAPNESYKSQLSAESQSCCDELELGMPMLPMLLSGLQMLAGRAEESFLAEQAARAAEREELFEAQRALEAEHSQAATGSHAPMVTSSGIHILRGEAIADRKSKFLAHVAPIRSVAEAEEVIRELRGNKWIAGACHPTIYAYRFMGKDSRVNQDCEDDGEHAASKKILFLMEQTNVLGYVVVVTRWFGGILLGPDRFKHIMECARQALVQHGIMK